MQQTQGSKRFASRSKRPPWRHGREQIPPWRRGGGKRRGEGEPEGGERAARRGSRRRTAAGGASRVDLPEERSATYRRDNLQSKTYNTVNINC
jgi:hypothetical protein